MSTKALRSHAAGKKYLEITHKVSCFFKKSRTVEKEENNKPESVAGKGPEKCTQTSLELTLASSEVARAEIRKSLDSVLKGNSNNQNANISTLFEVMFPECRTAKLLSLCADKLRYS